MTFDEILISYGWQFRESCSCGGTLRKKYKHPDHVGWLVTVSPLRRTFLIQEGARSMKSGILLDLDKALQDLWA